MIKSRGTFSVSLDNLFGNTQPIDAHDLSGAESLARSLIGEILDACVELQNIASNTRHDEQKNKQIEALMQKISTRRSKLESTKDTLMQYMHAAESNAQKLESQYLNDPNSEMSLQRAAGGAWSEVKRLEKLLEEIENALSMSDSAGNEIARIQTPREDDGDFRFTATSRDSRRTDDPSLRDNRGSQGENDTLKPLLGKASPGGLSESLKKIPIAAQGTSKIQAGLYKGGVYIENAHFNNLQMNMASQGSPASSNRDGRSAESSVSQKGGDGSYMAGGDMGVFSPAQKNDFGIW
ncbi:MAG: hypothetical protein M1418_06135 [Deltaproteobacteria bacterium]|nr:hypothetical protein [Deltaproteobacteria bacterium]